MAQESIQIADKPTLDEVKEIVENFKFMNIIECSFDSDKITIDPVKLTDTPYDFSYGSAVVLNGEIHILGGYESDVFRKHYKWDGSSWTSVSTIPYNFKEGCAVVLNGEIHILGGNGTGYNKHYKWDGSSWTSVSTLPYWMYGGCAVVLNGEIHILGSGYSSYSTDHYKWDGSSWTKVSTLPFEFYAGCAIVFNGELNILAPKASNKAHYKWDGSSWVEVSTLPYAVGCASTVIYNGKLHILGSNYNTVMNSHYVWNGSSWTNSGTLPINFYNGSAVVLNGEIHILGGHASKRDHYIIKEGQGKKIIIGLPKGTKILTQYSIDDMYGFTNCVKDGDYLVTTNDGVVEFLINTDATSAKLTLMY